ncbi:MAG: GTP-binding protein [Candidatus Lokiarchaeota archaeon]|nr:GTP-binding protein [Candidatus Lokiarchaeota archaeon]
MKPFEEFRFKIVILGDGAVGKTSLIQKFTKGVFEKEYVKTIGAQFSKYNKKIDGDIIRLIFWDIAGQIDFNFLNHLFYKEAKAAIIVFSLETNDLGQKSFIHITNWYKELEKYCGTIPVVTFANKVDLVDKNRLNESKIQKLAKENNFLGYYITSAKTGEGVIEAFNAIIDKLYFKYKKLSSID